jgi:hypothetical protein
VKLHSADQLISECIKPLYDLLTHALPPRTIHRF